MIVQPNLLIGRREPYTALGIKRKTCVVSGCSNKSHASWQVCANGRRHVPVCKHHDIELNRTVLDWMGHPHKEELMQAYAKRLQQ